MQEKRKGYKVKKVLLQVILLLAVISGVGATEIHRVERTTQSEITHSDIYQGLKDYEKREALKHKTKKHAKANKPIMFLEPEPLPWYTMAGFMFLGLMAKITYLDFLASFFRRD